MFGAWLCRTPGQDVEVVSSHGLQTKSPRAYHQCVLGSDDCGTVDQDGVDAGGRLTATANPWAVQAWNYIVGLVLMVPGY